jgi:hypothetical protein
MERLAEQIVAWHNRHPLARRIAVDDVHTIGVVALPFVRASAQAGGLVEPVLTEEVSFDELADSPRPSLLAGLVQRVARLVTLSRLTRLIGRRPRQQWRAFSEKFLPGLSPARVERFALAHGYTEPPATPDSQPWRVIVIDEALASVHGGWPFELYLMTAGIDVGESRTRVLGGRGIPSQIVGRRLWDPIRLGGAGGVLALLVATGTWWLWPSQPDLPLPAAAPAASAPVVAEPVSAPASQAAVATAASAPESAASEVVVAEGPPPDIRPHLVERRDGIVRPPLLSDKPKEMPAEKLAEKPAEKPQEKASAPADPVAELDRKPSSTDPALARMAGAPAKSIVALVGPAGSKADAEALLAKMKAGLAGVYSNPDALQADVVETPEGWRATVWPFASREQAQLINATLVARGLKTKAVNF